MSARKITILGGSGVATPELVDALVKTPGRSQPLNLVLNGRDAAKLERVSQVCQSLAKNDALMTISHTTDLNDALDGADFVLNQVRVGGLEARVFDESFPHELGLPGEETVGAGGFSNALRSIPVCLEYAHRMENLCPQATLLTFTNPSSMVQYAINRFTKLSTIGMCDVPITLTANIAQALGIPPDQLLVDYLGMHHFGWVSAVWHDGINLLPECLLKAGMINPLVEPAIIQAVGAIPCHYLAYVYHPERMLAKKIGKPTRAEELIGIQAEILTEYEHPFTGVKPAVLSKRKAIWYQVIIAPTLLSLIESTHNPDWPASRLVLNIINGQTIPWLPADAVVEVPVQIDHGCIHPFATGPLPIDIMNLVQANFTYESLAVEAIVDHDRSKALRALLRSPFIRTYDQAAGILDRVWK